MGGAYPGVRSRVRNLRKPSAAVRRDGGGDGESEGARERVAPSSLTLWRRVSPRALRFAGDSPLEESGFELVWGFSCQVVVFGLLPVLCSERERPLFASPPAIRFPDCA